MTASNKVAVANILELVEKRVEMLIAEHQKTSQLNKRLAAELSEARATKRELQEQLQALQIERDKLALQDGLAAVTKDPKRAAAYINRLMREVDNCIALVAAVNGTTEELEDTI